MRNPTRTRRTAGALGVVALAAAGATGTTWAAFSDFAIIPDNAVGAATVVVGAGDPGYDLTVGDLMPGVAKSVTLTVKYAGTIAADIALDIDPSTSTWCTSDGTPLPGGELQVSTDGQQTWSPYCGLGETPGIGLAAGLAPDGETTVTLHLRLTDDTDHRYSELTSTDRLTVTAVQSDGGRAFTDYATGTLTVGAATIAAPEPQSEELTSLRLGEPEAAVAPQTGEPATGEGTGAAEEPTGKTASEEPAGEVPSEEPAGDGANLPTEKLPEEPLGKESLGEAPPEASGSPEPPAAENPVSDNAASAESTSEDPLPEAP